MTVPPPPPPPYVAPDLRAIESSAFSRLTRYKFRFHGHYRLYDQVFENSAWVGADNAPLEIRIHRTLSDHISAEQAFYDSGDRGEATAAEVTAASVTPVDFTPLPTDYLGKVPRFVHVVVRRPSDGARQLDWTGPFCGTALARLDDPTGPPDPDLAAPCSSEFDDGFGFAGKAAGRLLATPLFSGLRQWRLGWNEGIDRGWALQLQLPVRSFAKLQPGRHLMTITVNPGGVVAESGAASNTIETDLYIKTLKFRSLRKLENSLFRTAARARTAAPQGSTPGVPTPSRSAGAVRSALGVPVLPGTTASGRAATPPPAGVDAPDLRSAPAFGIAVRNGRNQDFLRFSALEWNDGPGKLAVEAYRTPGASTLAAYQVFYNGWDIVGRQPRGSMEFNTGDGHHHFHFRGFARYSIVAATSDTERVASTKRSWCLAPTDLVDSTRPGFDSGSHLTSLESSCGSEANSLWARQQLDVGFGDTYDQDKGGQAFPITTLTNGTYRVKIEVNPSQQLAEADYSNNVSYRTFRLRGTRHHRIVSVSRDPILAGR